jgi:cellulose synthase/poly-beta-1,6-N-acetylglucosamine synthase-like glycosyltransferase
LLALILGVLGIYRSAKRYYKLSTDTVQPPLAVSVIIAVRNERPNIEQLMQHLKLQAYPKNALEIIIVDDHSDDGTFEWLVAHKPTNCLLLQNKIGQYGKKSALALGVSQASHDILLFTDGDCIPETNWVQKLVSPLRFSDIQMVCGPVFIHTSRTSSLFAQLQQLEFLSPLAVSMATLGWGFASMANGASFACRKAVLEAFLSQQPQHTLPASGDDMFLLHYIDRHYPNSIVFASGEHVSVHTNAIKNLPAFIQQRLRWAGKWRHFKSGKVLLLAIFSILVNINWIAALVVGLSGYWWFAIAAFICKGLCEWLFLNSFAKRSCNTFSLRAFVLLQAIYPFYALYIAFLSIVKRNYYWKGRIWSTH